MYGAAAWLTAERIRIYATIVFRRSAFLPSSLCSRPRTASSTINAARSAPISPTFYAAGKYVLEGKPDAPFSPPLQHKKEQSIFGADTPFYGWHYPPVFLALAAMLALLPYSPRSRSGNSRRLRFYLWNVLTIVREPRAFLPALAFPPPSSSISPTARTDS